MYEKADTNNDHKMQLVLTVVGCQQVLHGTHTRYVPTLQWDRDASEENKANDYVIGSLLPAQIKNCKHAQCLLKVHTGCVKLPFARVIQQRAAIRTTPIHAGGY